MKPDPLEQRLQHLPLRAVPDGWREQVLQAARSAARPQRPVPESRPTPWWRAWLWPCPEAWAGVAAVWCVIIALHLGAERSERRIAGQNALAPVPAQIWMAFDEQRRLLADLRLPEHAATRPPPSPVIPRPRSCRAPEAFVV